jgi:hypothetical protein
MGELIPGPPRVTAGRPFTIQAQVITAKAVPYQQYLARLKTDPTATLALAAPTGTVTVYDGAAAIGTAALAGAPLVTIPVAGLRAGRHNLAAAYSGDANYPSITFGSYQVDAVRAHRPSRFR